MWIHVVVEKKMSEFKKTIGQYVDQDQATQILWNCIDPRSKEIAMADGLDSGDDKTFSEHIDLRYNILYGTLDYKSSTGERPARVRGSTWTSRR